DRQSIELTKVSRNVAKEQIIVDAIAGPDHCLTASARSVGQSNSWPEVVRITVNFARRRIEDIADRWICLKFISNAGIKRQGRIDREVVLNKQTVVPRKLVCTGSSKSLEEVRRISIQKGCQTGEGEHSTQSSEVTRVGSGQRTDPPYPIDIRAE